jgi:hypothetical protein
LRDICLYIWLYLLVFFKVCRLDFFNTRVSTKMSLNTNMNKNIVWSTFRKQKQFSSTIKIKTICIRYFLPKKKTTAIFHFMWHNLKFIELSIVLIKHIYSWDINTVRDALDAVIRFSSFYCFLKKWMFRFLVASVFFSSGVNLIR